MSAWTRRARSFCAENFLIQESLRSLLIRHEGCRLKPYRCSEGKLTIAIGRNLSQKGVSLTEAFFLLENDIQDVLCDCRNIFPEFSQYAEARQLALADMRFNLGATGFRQFRRMIAAVQERDWERAAAEMIDSRWYTQVGRRGIELEGMMRTGERE